MTEFKPWYLSRTVWASIVTVGAAGAGLAGLTLGLNEQTALTDAVLQIVSGVSGVVAIVGRFGANARIG